MNPNKLNGVVLKIVTQEQEWVTGNIEPITGLHTGNVFHERVFRDLQEVADFRASLTVLKTDSSSSSYFIGGPGKMLATGNADVAIGAFYITLSRVVVSSPLMLLHTDRLFAYFVNPSFSTVRNIYLLPLHWSIFLCWGIVLFVTPIIAVARARMSFKKMKLEDIFLGFKGSRNRYQKLPLSVRIGIISSSFLSVFLSAIYTVKLLTVLSRPSYPVTNLEELGKSGYSFFAFADTDPLIPKGIKRRKFNVTGISVAPLSFATAIKEKHAHVDVSWESFGGTFWPFRFKYYGYSIAYPERVMCDVLSSVPLSKFGGGYHGGFFVSHDSPLRNVVNRNLLKIKETGLLWKCIKYPTQERFSCRSAVRPTYLDNLNLEDVSSAFIFLGTGFLGTIGVLIVEKVCTFGSVVKGK